MAVRALFQDFPANLSVAIGVHFEIFPKKGRANISKHTLISVSWSDMWNKDDVLDESYSAFKICVLCPFSNVWVRRKALEENPSRYFEENGRFGALREEK